MLRGGDAEAGVERKVGRRTGALDETCERGESSLRAPVVPVTVTR